VVPCLGAELRRYSTAGVLLSSVSMPGEAANDVDLDVAPAGSPLAGSSVAEGNLWVTNGETGPADIYAVDPQADAGLAPSLTTAFGNAHVVGGALHVNRGTYFAVQDRVPGASLGNQVAEIDLSSGAVLNNFSTLPNFDVNYGDLEVCQATGHLFLVSSNEASLAEFTPEGVFVAKYPLPVPVAGLSGIGIDDATGRAWVSGTGGNAWLLEGVPCGPAVDEI
jgi:hypothetical protein